MLVLEAVRGEEVAHALEMLPRVGVGEMQVADERPRVEDFSKEKKIYLKSSYQFNPRPTSTQAFPTNTNTPKLIFKPLLQNKSQNNLGINKEGDENLKRKLLKYNYSNYGKFNRKNCKLNTFILPKCPPAIFVGPK